MISSTFEPLRRLATRSIIYVLADALQTGVAFVLIPLYTAYLTPASYGILSITTALGNILGILYLYSLEGVFTRFYYDLQEGEERRRFFGSVWLFLLAYTLIVSLILEWIGTTVTPFGLQNIPYRPYVQIIVWTTFINNVAFLLPRALFLIKEEAWKYVALNFSLFLLSTLLIVYFVVIRSQGVFGVLEGRFLGSITIGLIALWVILKNIRFTWHPRYIKSSLVFALPLVPHLLSLWALDLSDRFILQRYVRLDDVGIYSLGYQVAAFLQLIAFSVSTAIGPFYYRVAATRIDATAILSKLSTYYLLLLAWIGVGMVALAQDAIKLIASRPEYFPAYHVVPWLVLGFFARGYYFTFVAALYYSKKVKALPFVTIGAAVVNVTINLILIPRFGYIAAAVNTFLTYALQAAVMYVFAQRAYPLDYESSRLIRLTLLGIFWAMALYSFSVPDLWLDIVLKTLVTLGFPAGLFLLKFFTAEELKLLYLFRKRWSPAS